MIETTDTHGDYVALSEDGNMRARLESDTWATAPEDETGPVVIAESGGTVLDGHHSAGLISFDAGNAWARCREAFAYRRHAFDLAYATFERYVKVFHGGTVTRIGSHVDRNAEEVIAIMTPVIAESWGHATPEAVEEAMRNGWQLDDWQAYLDSDVWQVVLEERSIRTTETRRPDGTLLERTEETAWVEYDRSGTIYGRECAKDEARMQAEYH